MTASPIIVIVSKGNFYIMRKSLNHSILEYRTSFGKGSVTNQAEKTYIFNKKAKYFSIREIASSTKLHKLMR